MGGGRTGAFLGQRKGEISRARGKLGLLIWILVRFDHWDDVGSYYTLKYSGQGKSLTSESQIDSIFICSNLNI